MPYILFFVKTHFNRMVTIKLVSGLRSRRKLLVGKRRRGTAIVDTSHGILVVSRDNRTFYLPGGGAERGESRRDATIRELKEETGLNTIDCSFLFVYVSFTNSHKVFLIESAGIAKPCNEIRYIDYFDGSNLKVSNTTWEIIELYKEKRSTEAFASKKAKFSNNS
jgi:8-oxo-dGTP diphosphatase